MQGKKTKREGEMLPLMPVFNGEKSSPRASSPFFLAPLGEWRGLDFSRRSARNAVTLQLRGWCLDGTFRRHRFFNRGEESHGDLPIMEQKSSRGLVRRRNRPFIFAPRSPDNAVNFGIRLILIMRNIDERRGDLDVDSYDIGISIARVHQICNGGIGYQK